MVTAAALRWSLVATPRRSRRRVLSLAISCLLPLIASADDYEGKTVASITFEPDRQPLTQQQLLDMLPIKIGQPLRSEDIRASIQRLYRTGEYADIAVDAALQNGNVNLRFITTASSFIGYI